MYSTVLLLALVLTSDFFIAQLFLCLSLPFQNTHGLELFRVMVFTLCGDLALVSPGTQRNSTKLAPLCPQQESDGCNKTLMYYTQIKNWWEKGKYSIGVEFTSTLNRLKVVVLTAFCILFNENKSLTHIWPAARTRIVLRPLPFLCYLTTLHWNCYYCLPRISSSLSQEARVIFDKSSLFLQPGLCRNACPWAGPVLGAIGDESSPSNSFASHCLYICKNQILLIKRALNKAVLYNVVPVLNGFNVTP